MGSLYTQHFSAPNTARRLRTSFEVFYEGALASANTTKPLFAALLKGLLSPVSTAESLNINIVNAELVARERGIFINESRSRDGVEDEGYSSSVTLRARVDPRSPSASRTSRGEAASARGKEVSEQVITGFVSNNTPYISRLGLFRTSFVPAGTLLICRNFDEPGKIGVVGGKLGKAGVNIRFMSVAPIEREEGAQGVGSQLASNGHSTAAAGEKEALMILGVDRMVEESVRKELVGDEGMLEAGVVVL